MPDYTYIKMVTIGNVCPQNFIPFTVITSDNQRYLWLVDRNQSEYIEQELSKVNSTPKPEPVVMEPCA